MFKKLVKIIMALFLVTLSPFVLVVLASAAVVVVFSVNGENFASAMQFLFTQFHDLFPFLPYVTGIPALLVVVLLTRNRKMIKTCSKTDDPT